MSEGKEFLIFGGEIQKARERNERLCYVNKSDWQMNVWTWRACDTVGWQGMLNDLYVML